MGDSLPEPSVKVFLWVVPRSCSTAFTKFMSFVDDVEIWHEPYNTARYNETLFNMERFTDNPSVIRMRQSLADNEEKTKGILDATPRGNLIDQEAFSYDCLRQQLQSAPTSGSKHVFCKAHPVAITERLESVPFEDYQHTFLIRHPGKVLPSLKKMFVSITFPGEAVENFDLFKDFPVPDYFALYRAIYDVWKLTTNMGKKSVIIDTEDLLNNPEKFLPEYFKEIGLQWKDRYLTWDSSSDVIRTWRASREFTVNYSNSTVFATAHGCDRFIKSINPKENFEIKDMSHDLQECFQFSLPFYQEMYQNRMT